MEERVRSFDSGADRDMDSHKIDPAKAISPLVVERFCEFMQAHSVRLDGTQREADNWQKGIPPEAYLSSLQRHNLHVWLISRGYVATDDDGKTVDYEEALCGVLFNAMGLLHENLKLDWEKDELCPGGVLCWWPWPVL